MTITLEAFIERVTLDKERRTIRGEITKYSRPTDDSRRIVIEPGAIRHQSDLSRHKLLIDHDPSQPVGFMTELDDAARFAAFKIPEGEAGDKALADAANGLRDGLSIGFDFPDEPDALTYDDEDHTVHVHAANLIEVSLVALPAFQDARVTGVAASRTLDNRPTDKETTMPDTLTREDFDSLATQVEDLGRQLDTLSTRDPEPVRDTRTAGQVLKAIVAGDEATIAAYEAMKQLAYTGGTTEDSILLPAWVGDLTRIIAESSPLPGLFTTGTLPAEGNTIEYGILQDDSTEVAEQAAEGDDLQYGEVKLTTATAPVKTYGGYTQLSRQQIERSSVNFLNHALNALALAAAKRRNATLRAFLATQRAARVDADDANLRTTVTVADMEDYVDWVGGIVDAAAMFEDLALPLQVLVTDKSVFKTLAALNDSAGRPLMTVYGSGSNVVGEVNPTALSGNLAGLRVVPDVKQAAPGATFVNENAIRAYNAPIVQLTDGNIVNLTQSYSVYFYAALAAEIPGALVPVVAADPA